MEQSKLYKDMTPSEQTRWITDMSDFSKQKLPILCQLGDAWETCHFKSFEEGLALINAFAFCRDFVKRSLMFRDFSRRISRMQFMIDEIKKQVADGVVVQAGNQTIGYIPVSTPTTRRRGRPTKEDQAAASTPNTDELEKAQALANLTGAVVVTAQPEPDAKKAPATQPEAPKKGESDLFTQAVAMSQGEARLHFDQIAWLMSPQLAADIKEVAALRALAAKESEQAKELAENGVHAAIIAPHSRSACECQEKCAAIYLRVDQEMATLYLRLQNDADFNGLKATMESKASSIEVLMDVLEPYFDKMNKVEGWADKTKASFTNASPTAQPETPVEQHNTGEPAVSEQDKSKRLHAIRTYMLRKDQKLTEKRISKMREFMAEAQTLGVNVEEYQVIIDKAVADFNEFNTKEE